MTIPNRLRQVCSLTAILPAMSLLASYRAGAKQPMVWTFESDTPERAPGGFSFDRTGDGKRGRWLVREEAGAPSGRRVLTQTDDDDTDYRFPLAVAGAPELKNLKLSVKCKTVAGKVDQVCGLVFRYRDADNYYVARTNALENNVRLYHVKQGRRVQFAGWNGKVPKNLWYDFAIEAREDRFQVFFQGRQVIEARDRTFSGAGKLGVWTKADSATFFDELTATALE